jgi:hypothetical protein
MSDTFGRGPNPVSAAATTHSATLNLIRVIAYLGIVFAVGVTGYYGYRALQAHSVEEASIAKLTELRGLTQPVLKHLAEEYRDTDGNLLADPPDDSASLLDPETLVLSHYIDAEADVQLVDWEALGAALAEATGKISQLGRRRAGDQDRGCPIGGHARRGHALCREQCRLRPDRGARHRGRRERQSARHRGPQREQD